MTARRVLLATDGAPPARAATRLLGNLTDAERVTVTILSVSGFDQALQQAREVGRYSPEAARTEAERVVETAVEDLRELGIDASGRITEGHPATEILTTIQRDGIDLTVLGAGRESWLGAILLGSTSTAILHASPSSVLVVHRFEERPRPGLLLGVDGSDGSWAAVRLVTALVDPERWGLTVVSAAGADERETADALVREVAGELGSHGFVPDTLVREGRPSTVLLEEAGRLDVGLVAVGSRGLGSVARVVLGSVSDHVAHHAPAALIARGP